MNWKETDYYYEENGVSQRIFYNPKTFLINRWDSVRGDDILDQKHEHYWDLFLIM